MRFIWFILPCVFSSATFALTQVKVASPRQRKFWDPKDEYSSLPHPTTLKELGEIGDEEVILQLMKRTQSPKDCATAKYFILDDPRGPSGFGYAFWQIYAAMLIAVSEDRVLVHAASVLHSADWQWCGHKPRDVSCYFKLWSPCIGRGGRDIGINGTLSIHDFPRYFYKREPPNTKRVVVGIPADAIPDVMNDREQFFKLSHVVWFGLAAKVLLRAHDWLDFKVDRFLNEHGALNNTFLAVHVRLGQKYTEAEMPPVDAYKKRVIRMAKCLNTERVLVVSETQAAVDELVLWGTTVGLQVFATNQHRHGADVWNTFVDTGVKTEDVDMDDEGYYAVFNLWASRKASGLVGLVSSQWAKLTDAMMFAHRGHRMPFLTLVPNDHDKFYLKEEEHRIVVGDEAFKWPCQHERGNLPLNELVEQQ